MSDATSAPRVDWDYTRHASHYDKRADYSEDAIEELLATIRCTPGTPIAEIGAGTGKLTKELVKHGLTVRAIEPNDAMRAIGIDNTRGTSVSWSVGTGEATGLPSATAYAAFFGSSFNVLDQRLALAEVARILVPRGWFVCMWNHRDLDDPIQEHIETIIKTHIAGYSYGSRREDPTAVIEGSGRFSTVRSIERSFLWRMSRSDITAAWRSHATLMRQAGSESLFNRIVGDIASYLRGLPDPLDVRYTTRIYFAPRVD